MEGFKSPKRGRELLGGRESFEGRSLRSLRNLCMAVSLAAASACAGPNVATTERTVVPSERVKGVERVEKPEKVPKKKGSVRPRVETFDMPELVIRAGSHDEAMSAISFGSVTPEIQRFFDGIFVPQGLEVMDVEARDEEGTYLVHVNAKGTTDTHFADGNMRYFSIKLGIKEGQGLVITSMEELTLDTSAK